MSAAAAVVSTEDSNAVVSRGRGGDGQLGHCDAVQCVHVALHHPSFVPAVAAAATCRLHVVTSWGRGEDGQLGHDDTEQCVHHFV